MGVKGEVHFVKVAGARLLQGPVMVRSSLWDGEIEIATIPDYCAYLRVMSWVDIFDVRDIAAVRAKYEEERAQGGYEIPDLLGASEITVQDPDELETDNIYIVGTRVWIVISWSGGRLKRNCFEMPLSTEGLSTA